ncbi:FAD-binding oxidoreductase [Aestuariicella sp. G3-2]|uniref:D-2-hydroxyglutarate dehydrogenase YdiJ n=1 Tax=Pseudomaricurvus albidus TaxID=2842452 RepID=UPI001C0BB1E6|nr:FAD-binding and (Fe-S)-binding domain-containing protein [Aestuariicella albida]MBU3069666.1 FAD-binding oxidoreductase [Aestuariicella albida]
MIPSIRETSPVQAQYLAFIEALKACGFEGELNPDYANRTVLATDNSIYQVLPQGVIYPKNATDLVRVAELSNLKQFRDIVLSPRGGGTGTNGQSLTDGLIIDISKHMNRILEINAKERWVKVQAGVVKDQLNAALKPYGLFFAPELSTSNRATIGGMINTDASGQGSCLYGKTRDHVLSLTTVFMDGSECTSHPLEEQDFDAISQRQDRVGELHRVVNNIHKEHHAAIEARFPKLNRCLTGYDLAHIRTEDGKFDLNSVLCGSEGTLGFITEAKLNLLPIPKCSALINVKYENFNAALRDATELMKAGPTSIETVDSKVLNLAMGDIVWNTVEEFFPPTAGKTIQGINLVEYTADDEETLKNNIKVLTDQLDARADDASSPSIGYSVAWGADSVAKIWGMRKKSVGLLGNAKGEARPIPFVEDTAVPPENLADFIMEFREVLDSHDLAYGMFGHVDAGVLHVRPAIDMKDPEQEKMVRVISDKVAALTQKYNGLLWGEHGKGVRSEYAPAFFGDLYPQLQRIKATCDPRNQLNPGKIATPHEHIQLATIDGVVTRGQEDRKIPVQVWEGYSEGMHCNGNGACFNWDPKDAMCPSWKGTRERIHSPKGRASLVREWLKQLSERGIDPLQESAQAKRQPFWGTLYTRTKNTLAKRRGEYDFSNEVMESMAGCLACKSCVGQCPIKVDVPSFRSKFMELYYSRYLRPLKDYFIGGLEYMIPTLARVPWLYNGLMKPAILQKAMARVAGMVDSPLLTGINLDTQLQQLGLRYAVAENIRELSDEDKQRSVIVVQDAFTSYFETQVVVDALKLLKSLGFNPLLAPFKANGKPLHVHGFLKAFENTANNTAEFLNTLSNTGIPLIGIEPSMTLAYRSEYQKVMGDNAPKVQLLQEWLATQTDRLAEQKANFMTGDFKLLAHCTEKTNAAASMKDWGAVFSALGQQLSMVDVGCCGMAGTYGHEAQNVQTSKRIYELSWSQAVNAEENQGKLMATGYSCRSQAKRMDDLQLPHPFQVLLSQMH